MGVELTNKEHRALLWLRAHKQLKVFTPLTPSFTTMRNLRKRGLVCDRKLAEYKPRSNVACVVYRPTWLGLAALKLAL